MAQVFNPWANPPTDSPLTGDLASFEINDQESPAEPGDSPSESDSSMESESAGHGDAMAQALQVISQQADLISKLMATLGK